MAGSRLEKFGTVYTRVRDLMRSGVIKESQKPLWFDVYTAFPPKREPLYVKSSKRIWPQKRDDHVPEIFYKEDEIRAKFFKVYGIESRPFDLSKTYFLSTCQRFVDKYSELESRGDVNPENLFEETAKALLAAGVLLRRVGGTGVRAKRTGPVLDEAVEQKDSTEASEEQEQSVPTESSTPS
ncbi:28S ribosomal protein S23, mitochondrial [Astyanax mexicanus]|uniref:28S ribosomal protein S23, mitochondrial n=1 Tax=Astyanax mexicanus TaxID=7994 RepID=UPI0020CB4EBA|nr:28S ribosomal protein S23, mitochondrial [Astyanax mexicanus]